MYQGQTNCLEIMVYDYDVGRDNFMGRYVPGSNEQSADHGV